MASVSVVIPCFNAQRTLAICVEALLANSVRPLEIVLVDDASSDPASPALADALAAAHPGTVRAIRLEKNGGPAVARNRGAAVARGAYLVFVDSDTKPSPDLVEKFLARIPEADAVSGIYAMEPLNDEPVARYKAYLNYYAFSLNGVIAYETFAASTAGIRADVFAAHGGFNEKLAWGMDYENEEFGRRIIERHKLLLDPAMTSQHLFPGFGKLTRTYFSRVALWMEFFLKNPKLESGGPATPRIGIGTAAAPAALGFAVLGFLWPGFFAASAALWLVFVYCMAGFYRFVLRHRPGFLPAAIALNIYFSSVIACGAAYGVLRSLAGRGRAASAREQPKT